MHAESSSRSAIRIHAGRRRYRHYRTAKNKMTRALFPAVEWRRKRDDNEVILRQSLITPSSEDRRAFPIRDQCRPTVVPHHVNG